VMSCMLWARYSTGDSGSIGAETLELWDLATQKRLAIWNQENLREGNSFIRFSPDGKRVATCSSNGVIIRDAATGNVLHNLSQSRFAGSVLFSLDSKLIFSAIRFPPTDAGTIVVSEVETGREIGHWRGHQGPVTALALDPEGFYLASGGEDRTICIWQIPSKDEVNRRAVTVSGHQLYRWEAHKTTVTALAFAPVWGSTLATGGADGTLRLWNILSISKELETMGLSSRRPLSSLTKILLIMMGVGSLTMITVMIIKRLRPAFPAVFK
jgi:WD40 repeat protein